MNTNNKLKACAYVRVSSRSEYQRNSLDEQTKYWNNYFSNQSDYEFVKIYSDYGYSGKINNRPAYRNMIKDALDGKIDIIFTKSVSRFGRNLTTLLSDIHALRENSVFVYFESENINTQNANNDLYLSIYSSLAEDQLRSNSESIKFGFHAKFQKGFAFCKPIFGYNVVKNDNDYIFTIIPDQAQIVKLIFELYNSKKTFTEIAKYLTEQNYINKDGNCEWHAHTIPLILSNEKYMGVVYSQKYFNKNFKTNRNDIDAPDVEMYVIENHHEPIISADVFITAQSQLKTRIKRTYKKHSLKNDTFNDLIFCEKCGSPYKRIIRKSGKGEDFVTYRCGKNRYKGECCHNSTMYPDTFKYLFIRAYNEFTKIKNIGTEQCYMLNAKIAVIQGEIDELRHMYLLKNISFDSFSIKLDALLKEQDAYKKELDIEVGHFIYGKKIPTKITIYNEELLKQVLKKALIFDDKISFHFVNGVIIQKEFSNPKPGKTRKIL